MKYLLVLMIALSTSTAIAAQQEQVPPKTKPVVKRVCVKIYDARQQKRIEKCRDSKIFKKKPGTPIPKQISV